MSRIIYDGLNLSLQKGTGIATYTRHLTRIARSLSHDVGVVYSTPFRPAPEAVLREVAFFHEKGMSRVGSGRPARRLINKIRDTVRYQFAIKPHSLQLGQTVVSRQFEHMLAEHDRAFVEQNLFINARYIDEVFGRFTTLQFDPPCDIFHCTYPLPLQVNGARNVHTIHDLVPLKLPHTTLDNKRTLFRFYKRLIERCDHIVTVSEASRKDIIELLGVSPDRVTNTYQMVEFPQEYTAASKDELANYLDGAFGLTLGGYLLFFGALEPKKNVLRLIEGYLSSGVQMPLILVASGGWQNDAETALLAEHTKQVAARGGSGPVVRRLDYVGLSTLVALMRGARALLFPSLYEGFGLPVAEAMSLGVPVVTSDTPALAEVTAGAALLVDPYRVDDIAKSITAVATDSDLCDELSSRGLARSVEFSAASYRTRVAALYASLA